MCESLVEAARAYRSHPAAARRRRGCCIREQQLQRRQWQRWSQLRPVGAAVEKALSLWYNVRMHGRGAGGASGRAPNERAGIKTRNSKTSFFASDLPGRQKSPKSYLINTDGGR